MDFNQAQLKALEDVRLLVLDVDGTLTDGRVIYMGEQEQQNFCVRDGQGLSWLKKAGIKLAWITGRGCASTKRRAEELGVDALFMRAGPKREILAQVQEQLGISATETISMGDDLPDLGLRSGSAFFATPADGRAELREVADLVTSTTGGSGAVRELAECILRAQGRWQAIITAQVE